MHTTHRSTTGHVSKMNGHLRPAFLVLLALTILLGCKEKEEEKEVPGTPFYPVVDDPFQQNPTERDSVFAYLQSIDQEAFQSAFPRLSNHTFTRYTRTEQFDEEDRLIAYEEHVVRHTNRGGKRQPVILDADSAGSFDYGYFDRFVSETVSRQVPPNLAKYVTPEDPVYMSERNREAYQYRFLPDTLMWDRTARVIEIRARPEAGDGFNIRRVRLFIDRASKSLIAMYVNRIDLALLFREESQFYVHIRPLPSGGWVPYNTRFESRISVPYRPTQLFRTVSTYYNYEPV